MCDAQPVYIEIDSSFRNRNVYPYPAEFVVEFTPPPSQVSDFAKNAVDPVSDEAALLSFQSNFNAALFDNVNFQYFVSAFAYLSTSGLGALSDGGVTSLVIQSNDLLQPLNNFYVGAKLANQRLVNAGDPQSCGIITSYTYLGNNTAIVGLLTPVISVNGDVLSISTITTAPEMGFIPNGSPNDNSYKNLVLCNNGISYKVVDYDGASKMLTVSAASAQNYADAILPLVPSNLYTLRTSTPALTGRLYDSASASPDVSTSVFSFPYSSTDPFDSIYTNPAKWLYNFLELDANVLYQSPNAIVVLPPIPGETDNVTKIALEFAEAPPSGYFNSTAMTTLTNFFETSSVMFYKKVSSVRGIVSVSPPFSQPVVGNVILRYPQSTARRIVRYVSLLGRVTTATLTMFETNTKLNLPPSSYVGVYVSVGGQVRLLSSVNTNTNTGLTTFYVNTPFLTVPLPGTFFSITSGVVSPSFPFTINIQNFTLLRFSRDNAAPLNYLGPKLSARCYTVTLLNLVLPNQFLLTGSGGQIAFYPYVFVELQNVTSPTAPNVNVFYSNNPNSTNQTHYSVIPNVSLPGGQKFINCDGTGANSKMQFRIGDALYFKVTLPTGELFVVDLPEFYSPTIPNEAIQISAQFSLLEC